MVSCETLQEMHAKSRAKRGVQMSEIELVKSEISRRTTEAIDKILEENRIKINCGCGEQFKRIDDFESHLIDRHIREEK